jgi:hypothetical protein
MVVLTDTGGGGFLSTRGDEGEWCVSEVLCNNGSGFVTACKSPGGWGDGKKPPMGERGTDNFFAGTAKNRETITRVSNADGTGISFKSGVGKPIIQLATGDGKNGMMITEGYIALYTQNCYLVIDANRGVTFSNNFRVQEGPPDSPKAVNKRTFGLTDA